jgi:hypothetical protein
MKLRDMLIIVGIVTVLLVGGGIAGALAQVPITRSPSPDSHAGSDGALALSDDVASGINYQGRLTDPGGVPLNGPYTMRFIVYDAEAGGSAVYNSGNLNIQVQNGLFNVKLDVGQADFNGQALWLGIVVDGETLTPRQEILPAPYAMSLRPGADIVGKSIAPTDATLASYAPSTGTALYADANGGAGLYGASEDSYGVWGSSEESWGGYFNSENGYGIRVNTSGTDHYDYGAYITSAGGYGVFAQSEMNQGVRGEAGDVSSVIEPLGPVGVVGLGANRGVYGASDMGTGVFGRSGSNYGGYFYSNGWRALYASSPAGQFAGYFVNRGASVNEPGIYVDGTIVATGSKAGYVVDVMLNAGSEPLESGDVVAVVGVDDPVLGEIPVMRVVKASAGNAGAVVGVVDQHFVFDEVDGELVARPQGGAARLASGSAVQPGEYLSVVTLGAFKAIKVDASLEAVQPGDLLTSSPNAGYAMRAGEPLPGTIIGKALESLESGQGAIAVYVTLQ